MPIRDWTRSSDAAYHSFQLGWASGQRARLNAGIHPHPLYALTPIFRTADRQVPCPLDRLRQLLVRVLVDSLVDQTGLSAEHFLLFKDLLSFFSSPQLRKMTHLLYEK